MTILDGPEEDGRDNNRSKIWRRLSFVKLLSPFFRSSVDLEDIDECSSNFEHQKPSWRCFSYEEISYATDNFHQGENQTINDNESNSLVL